MSEITYNNDEMFRAFKNRTSAGKNHRESLTLEVLPDGTYTLLAYDWGKIADISADGRIRVFGGWAEWAQSRFEQEYPYGGEATTTRHIRELTDYLADCGRDFEVVPTRPEVGSPPESLRLIGHRNVMEGRRTGAGRTE